MARHLTETNRPADARSREPSEEYRRAEAVLPGACLGDFRLPSELAFIAARGQGATVWDTAGNQYIDYLLGSGPLVLGHAHPAVVAAVQEQVAKSSTFYTLNEPAIELAEKIVEMVPCAEAVKYASDGTGATFYSLRLARAFTGKNLVLKFEGGFHGHSDYALQSFTPSVRSEYPKPIPDSAGIPQAVGETVLIVPFNDLEMATEVAELHRDDLAAIIVEPHQRALAPLPGFLQGLRALADRLGCLLVFDEVVTGFRLAPGGAQELYGVTPDLAALGKIMGGGLPISAVAGRRDVLDLSIPDSGPKRVYIGGTLNGNPLAAAAGLAALRAVVEENVCAQLVANGEALRDGLMAAAKRLSVPLQVIGHPSFTDAVFGTGPITNYREYLATNRAAAKAFGLELLRRGIYLRPASKIYMSAAHTPEQLEFTVEKAEEAMRVVRDQGFFDA
ncbi:aspartate aminotransferase family protein [bacterium]|nr:MAG: aspartate aminotransferase family protein [bacterium]